MIERERVLINGTGSALEARVREFLGDDREQRLIVDVGSGETPFKDSFGKSRHVFVDPAIKGEATIGSVVGARVAAVRAPIEDVAHLMYERADRVQIIAPDPDSAEDVVLSSVDMVRKGGRMVVAFDRNSNKRESIPGAAGRVRRVLIKDGFSVTITEADQTLVTEERSMFNLGLVVLAVKSKE